MEYVRVYDGLTRARQRLFEWVRPLSQEQYTRTFPFGLGTLRATLLEIAQVELFYRMRLRGESLPPIPLPDTFPIGETKQPSFADLEKAWTEQSKETRAALADTQDWDTLMHRRVEQDDQVVVYSLSKGEIATQLLMHEVHHRAQAMAMLRQLGVPAQDLDYAGFVVRRQELPKDSTSS
jgi:uncharacterized damage-inducible protein DinB